jgi:heat-inducible transcriptional repressor
MKIAMDERALSLLRTLVERYIADGQPIGSRTLSRASGLELSPATIRNVMADLEELGLIASPHTSAGRVPTARGYRLFVDMMMTTRPLEKAQLSAELASAREQLQPDQPQRVIAQAAQLLSNLSHFVGVITAPRRPGVVRHIEFLRLGARRVILVTTDADVQNRMIITTRDYTHLSWWKHQLRQCALPGSTSRACATACAARSAPHEIAHLMQAAVQAGSGQLGDRWWCRRATRWAYRTSGTWGRCASCSTCREEDRPDAPARGVQPRRRRAYIGVVTQPFEELSVVSAPYEVDGRIVGTLGVIGPPAWPTTVWCRSSTSRHVQWATRVQAVRRASGLASVCANARFAGRAARRRGVANAESAARTRRPCSTCVLRGCPTGTSARSAHQLVHTR